MSSYYAVANGKRVGIFLSWPECSESVKNFPNAKYKKFKTKEEAEQFIQEYQGVTKQNSITKFFPTPSFEPDYYVYTDGACTNNGKPTACAGIGVYFGKNDSRNISKRIEGKQTNNTAEITAIIEAHRVIQKDLEQGKKVTIMTDSTYVMNCIDSYGDKCAAKQWNVEIPNKELVQTAYNCLRHQPNINVVHVKAHTNNTDVHSYGNAQADRLANEAVGQSSCPYAPTTKIYLDVPFQKKDVAKQWGARWDASAKQWYILDNNVHKEDILCMF
jgi:ribonuclease HI